MSKTKGIKIFLLTYLVLIVLGRLILRVHYPSDVIAGMLLSYSWINFSFQIVQRYLPAPEPEEAEVPTQRRRRHSRKRKSLFVVFSLTLFIFRHTFCFWLTASACIVICKNGEHHV